MGHPHVPLPHTHAARQVLLAMAIALATLVVVLPGRGGVSVEHGSGVAAVQRRDVGAFSGVDLAGASSVVVHAGRARSVTVTGDEGLLDHVTTRVVGGRLVVGSHGSYRSTAPMQVEVGVPSVRLVVLSGAGELRVDGVRAPRLRVDLGGAGTVRVGGRTGRLDAILSGGGTVDLAGLRAREVHAMLDGGGTMRVHATRRLDASVRGWGTIAYRGHPRAVTETVTGAGVVTRG